MESKFKWEDLGNLEVARPTLGPLCDVIVYRLLQYTLRDVINAELGDDKGGEFLYKAGEIAGHTVFDKFLSDIKDFTKFIAKVVELLLDLKVAIVRMEESDPERGYFVVVATEDLDCSGVPDIGKTICQFDEGLVAGIFCAFLNKKVTVRETECWAKGARWCRLEIKVEQ